jgi:very-short-patch-repair endonuclease
MIICNICGHTTENSLQSHLKHKHNKSVKEYRDSFPEATVFSELCLKKVSEGVKNLWKDETYVKQHGEALKIAQNTPEAKENHRKGALNYFLNRTEEQKEKYSKGLRKGWSDPEIKNKRVAILKEAHNTSEAIKNHSKATKEHYDSLTVIEKEARRKNLRDTWRKPGLREKLLELSKIGLKAAMSPEGRANAKKANKNPKTIEKRRRAAIERLKNMPVVSSLNIKFEEKLKNKNIVFEKEHRIDYYIVDFCFPSKKIVVEVDGDYWHGNPLIYNETGKILNKMQRRVVGKDKAEKTYLTNRGWKLIRFWEKDINENIDKCIDVVAEALNEF